MGLEFLRVQKEIEVHFVGLIFAASLFTLGIGAFVWVFIRSGFPVGRLASKAEWAPDAEPETPAAPATDPA